MQLATELGILSPLLVREAKLWMSLYTDDTVMFIKLDVGKLDSTLRILHEFGSATGLKNQRGQMLVATIRCQDIDLDATLAPFASERVSFPIKYLGMPLCLGRLHYVHLQHVLDRACAHLASWKG
jgi:hypothetical protein